MPNPHAGRLYFDNNWVRRIRTEKLDNFRGTASTEFNFGKWGEYRLAALGEYEVRNEFKKGFGEVWEGRPFATAPEASTNQVRRRHYITEGEFSTYHVGAASPGINGLFKDVTDPVTGRKLSSHFVVQSSPAPASMTRRSSPPCFLLPQVSLLYNNAMSFELPNPGVLDTSRTVIP